MRKFQVTVNGNTYEVDVAEVGVDQVVTAPAEPPSTSHVTTKATGPVAITGTVGSTLLEAPMQGSIVGVKVTAGQSVAEGDVVAILEAMKMENEIVAPKAGIVATVNVTSGQTVEAGDLIASLN